MKEINPLIVDQLVEHVFSHDAESLNSFHNNHAKMVLEICELISESYKLYLRFDNKSDPDLQFSHLTGHVYSIVERLFTSLKLLCSGFVNPSGNQMRVALESVALSALLSWRGKMNLPANRNKWKKDDFFLSYIQDKSYTRPHRALYILDKNKELIGFTEKGINIIKHVKDLYNNHSHASFIAMRAALVNENQIIFGGGYNNEQKEIYEAELNIRKNVVITIPKYLEGLWEKCA